MLDRILLYNSWKINQALFKKYKIYNLKSRDWTQVEN